MQFLVNAGGITIMILTARVLDWYQAMERTPAAAPAVQPAVAARPGERAGI
jgi:hypothetical protein